MSSEDRNDPPSEEIARTNARHWRLAVYVAVLLAGGVVVVVNARDAARRERIARCAANLKQIDHAILQYREGNRGCYPRSFVALASFVSAAGVPTVFWAFACPDSKLAPPESVADIAAGRCDYVLILESTRSSQLSNQRFKIYSSLSADEAVAIERPGHHPGSVHVLYADGRVELCPLSTSRCTTWIETQDDAVRGKPIRWPASQPTR